MSTISVDRWDPPYPDKEWRCFQFTAPSNATELILCAPEAEPRSSWEWANGEKAKGFVRYFGHCGSSLGYCERSVRMGHAREIPFASALQIMGVRIYGDLEIGPDYDAEDGVSSEDALS